MHIVLCNLLLHKTMGKVFLEEYSSEGIRMVHDIYNRATNKNSSSFISTFRAKIDHPICLGNDLQVMFYK